MFRFFFNNPCLYRSFACLSFACFTHCTQIWVENCCAVMIIIVILPETFYLIVLLIKWVFSISCRFDYFAAWRNALCIQKPKKIVDCKVDEFKMQKRFGKLFLKSCLIECLLHFLLKILFTNHNKWWICNENTYVLIMSDNGGVELMVTVKVLGK